MRKKIFALGFFDGVHLGHQALLTACEILAREENAAVAAITFDRHPQSLFMGNPPALLNSASDRALLLRQFGVEHIECMPVTEKVMSTDWETFLENLVEQGGTGFVCGDDFRFGHKGEGNAEKLAAFCRERGLPCVIIPEQTMDGVRISSTHIRTLVENGEMEDAAKFLGHPHILSGEVVSGRQLGRTIGIPTANVLLPEGVVVPKLGVYACICVVDGRSYVAVTNVGSRPTVDGHQVRAESWLLDFSGDLYGKKITLQFYEFLRPEEKFPSLEALKAKIQQDGAKVQKIFGNL
ncbi:MAG: bifunctional riboflavin kinase/FAD synthetase [Ruminococcaceae bacterium]|nr:bifunctional riboflavin kinase/FAD synthetase [Oscillospiraceae bacterium]